MDGEEIQPTRISKDEYVKFKQWVQDVHGTTKGHLSTEIENALREYRQPSNEQGALHRIENDVATIKAQLAEGESDGGVALSEENIHTHTEPAKPGNKAPRMEKVDWFIEEYYNRSGGQVLIGVLKDQLRDEFGFQDGIIEEYTDMVLSELDAQSHPEYSGRFIWGESIEQVEQELREQADEQLQELDK